MTTRRAETPDGSCPDPALGAVTAPPGARTPRRGSSGHDLFLDCVHCGLCLPFCPSYDATGREADSPRGRAHLLRAIAEGRIGIGEEVLRHMDLCLVCRACESACPSGVRMATMVETFRAETLESRVKTAAHVVGTFLAREIIPYRGRIGVLSSILRLYRLSGLRRLTRRILRPWPTLQAAERLLPAIPPRRQRTPLPEVMPARGERRARVGLFLGCVASHWFAGENRATAEILRLNGCEVVVPRDQTCCGALHRHMGLSDDARGLYLRNLRAFPRGLDAIVVNAAGCLAALREPPEGLDGSDASAGGAPGTASEFAPRCLDTFEFLEALGPKLPVSDTPLRVAVQEHCHICHGLRLAGLVRRVLSRIPGLEFVELPDADRCCGSAGIYNILHPRISSDILAAKVDAIRLTEADVVLSENPGCLIQIRAGIEAAGIGTAVRHPVEMLWRLYQAEGR